MKRFWLRICCPALVVCLVSTAQAVEPYFEFVEGLRVRGYYDFALLYLDGLASRPGVPEEVRQAISFEKATTLQQSARSLRNLEAKTEQLAQAEALLEQFVKENPLHPRVGQANSERARILLGRAEVATWQSRSPSNVSKKKEFQEQARALVKQAREIFKQANEQHLAKWKSFPSFIDEREDPQQFRERREAEIAYIRSQIDLALCTYAEAQTYDKTDPEFAKLLTQASLEFNDIHTRYRSLVAGLFARMWEGKCFEEQDEIRKALGIYNELLEHGKPAAGEAPKPVSSTMRRLQDKVLQFRLICLNHEKRKDYQVVIDEATEWLRNHRRRSETSLAIMWERARAREALGTTRTLPESDRNKFLNSALGDAREINRWPGEYKDVSTFMKQRLMVLLDKNPQDPQDFDTAFGLGRSLVKQIQGINDEIAAAANKEKRKELETQRTEHLDQTTHILELALALADEETDPKQVNHARYMLAMVYYYTRQSYKAAILGEFVGRNFDKENAQLGLDAAFLSMAAYIQAQNDLPTDQDPEFEMRQMARLANLITEGWPESEQANRARMALGRVYGQLKQPVDGANWYSQVPKTAPQYTSAQLAAGQSYWTAYLEAAPLPDGDPKKPAIEELQKWQENARKHLETGIAEAKAKLPEKATDGEIFDEYIAARVSLAQVLINQGQYQAAIDLLLKDPHAVMNAIAVKDEAKRPKDGIQGLQFAALCYQLLLRSYVGTQQIDLALKAMADLEKLTPDADGVMQIYVQLGRELEKEIERLQKLNQTERLAEVRTSFEKFLNELYERRESMTAGSLIWIAETYYGLAKGLGDDKAAATAYYNKAADTYREILDKAAAKGSGWLDPARIIGVKVRLVHCRRRQGEFEQALALAGEILAEKPNALDVQFEGAYVVQDWADSGQGESWKQFLVAIKGRELGKKKGAAPLWGWALTANKLQQLVDFGSGTPEHELKMYEARYNSIWCRHRYAMAQSSTPKKKQALEAARYEMAAFVAISAGVDEEWQQKFNELNREILESMAAAGMKDEDGKTIVVADLNWPAAEVARPKPVKPKSGSKTNRVAKKSTGTAPEAQSSTGTNWIAVVLGLLVAGGAGFGVWYVMTRQGTPRPVAVYAESAPVFPTQGAQPAQRRRAAGKPQAARSSAGQRKPAAQQSSAAKPQRPRTRPPQQPS